MENQEETKPTPAKSKSASQKAPKMKIDTLAKTEVEGINTPKAVKATAVKASAVQAPVQTPVAQSPVAEKSPTNEIKSSPKPTSSLTDQEKMLVTENLEPEPERTKSFKLMPESVVKRETQKPSHTKEIILSGIILLALIFGGYQGYLWYLNKQSKVVIKPVHTELNKLPTLQDTAMTSSTTPISSASSTATSTLIAVASSATSTPATSTPVVAKTTLKINNTPTGYLNVRSLPSSSGALVTQVHPGETYTYTNKKSGWYQITLNDGTSGWVSGQYVVVQ